MTVKIRDTISGKTLNTIPKWPGGALPNPGDRLRIRGRNYAVETAPRMFDLSGRDDALELTVTLIARPWGQSQSSEEEA